MKAYTLFNTTLLIILFTLGTSSCTNGESNWTNLFENGNVSQWKSDRSDSFPKYGWSVEGDELIIIGSDYRDSIQAGNLITREKFGNFEFSWEWKMLTIGGNSGVKYFVPGKGDDYSKYGPGPEYQLLDDANHPWMLEGKMQPNDYHTLGACYELYEADPSKAPAPLGEWNTSLIISKDGRVEHWLNGKRILVYDRFSDDFRQRVAKSKFSDYGEFGGMEKGHILLQDHPGEVHFRNIKIKTAE